MSQCPPSPIPQGMPISDVINNINNSIQNIYNNFTTTNLYYYLVTSACQDASLTTIGSNSLPTEAADSTAWTNNGGDTLDIWIQTRTGYYAGGDKTLYAYMRKFSFNCLGMLTAVSGETRYTVDAAVSC